MKIRSSNFLRMSAIPLALLLITLPNGAFSKTAKAQKKAENTAKSAPVKKGQQAQTVRAGQDPLQCDAQSAVLMDGLTGQVLYEQNPKLRIAPASFVKVMTLYLVYDAIRAGQLKMDEMVTVSETAWKRAWKRGLRNR